MIRNGLNETLYLVYIYTYMFGSKRTIISTNLLRAFYYKNFFVNSISGLNLE